MEGQLDLAKEAFALFGAAYFHSELIHRELSMAFASLTFEDPAHITGPRVEEKLSRAFSMTLGQVVDQVKPLTYRGPSRSS